MVLQVIFTNRFDACFNIKSKVLLQINYSRKGRRSSWTSNQGKGDSGANMWDTTVQCILSKRSAHFNGPTKQVTSKIITVSQITATQAHGLIGLQNMGRVANSWKLKSGSPLTTPQRTHGNTSNKFPYYQEWDHRFPLQRKKPLLPCFLPRISMTPIHTHLYIFPFPLEIYKCQYSEVWMGVHAPKFLQK